MKTYYCVTSSFDDRGRATANITNIIKAEEKPESTYTSTRRKDIYIMIGLRAKKKHKSMRNKQGLHKVRAAAEPPKL
jgi:hypothetical protein